MLKALASVAIAIVCTEAITQLVVHSEIFGPLRAFAQKLGFFFGLLVNCGYCFSVWAAIPCAYLMAPLWFPTPFIYCNVLIWTLFIHRCSNFLDDFADRYLAEQYETFEENEDENPFVNADQMFGIIQEGSESSQVEIEPEE